MARTLKSVWAMKTCVACGLTILWGGVPAVGGWACSAGCRQKARWARQNVDRGTLELRAIEIHRGPCPRCGREGAEVDVWPGWWQVELRCRPCRRSLTVRRAVLRFPFLLFLTAVPFYWPYLVGAGLSDARDRWMRHRRGPWPSEALLDLVFGLEAEAQILRDQALRRPEPGQLSVQEPPSAAPASLSIVSSPPTPKVRPPPIPPPPADPEPSSPWSPIHPWPPASP